MEESQLLTDEQLEKAERFLAEYADDKSQKQQIAYLKEMVALYKEAMAQPLQTVRRNVLFILHTFLFLIKMSMITL